jgi:predicted transcriptional regulator
VSFCYLDIKMAGRSTGTKNIMLRLDPELAERLQTVADVEGRSVSDVLREAVARLVEERRSDERFLRLLEENLARHQRLLRALRDQDDGS